MAPSSVQTDLETKTTPKVGTSLKVLSVVAILGGVGFALFAAAPLGKFINIEPIRPRPLLVKDVTDAIATSLWSTDWMSLYYDNGDRLYTLGDLPHGAPGTYIDGASAETQKTLVVGTLTPQKARVVAVQIFDELVDSSDVKTICIPADNTSFTQKRYYIDSSGSAFGTKEFSTAALTNCNQVTSKSFYPTNITSAILNTPYPSYFVNIGLHKDKYLLGYYNTDHTFLLTGNQGMAGSKAPFWINISATSQSLTLPQRTLQLTTNLGTKTLCIPETAALLNGGQKEYYYDINGMPYSDPLLTQAISCSSS